MFATYVISGALSATGGLFYAARFMNASQDVGLGLEVDALTAVVLGGVSLMGGSRLGGASDDRRARDLFHQQWVGPRRASFLA